MIRNDLAPRLGALCQLVSEKPLFRSEALTILLQKISTEGLGKFFLNIKICRSLAEYQRSPLDWLYYLSYASIYRYASAFLQAQAAQNVPIANCARNVAFQSRLLVRGDHVDTGYPCRWPNGTAYLNEIYLFIDYENHWLNFGILFLYVIAMMVLTMICYSMPMPHFIKRKFRFKWLLAVHTVFKRVISNLYHTYLAKTLQNILMNFRLLMVTRELYFVVFRSLKMKQQSMLHLYFSNICRRTPSS